MALGEMKGGESAEREGDQESREVRESEHAERWSGGQSRGEKKECERGDIERVSERWGEREGWCAVGAGGVAGEWKKRKERERGEQGRGERKTRKGGGEGGACEKGEGERV
ncbi:hypothetical protein AAC387_Pa07g2632 [Persea americana]